jgi:hypothetical protein
MPSHFITITLIFDFPLNVSVQIGDTAYYVPTQPLGATQVWAGTITPHETQSGNIIEIGEITGIQQWDGTQASIICNIEPTTTPPTTVDFIFFSKDNKANLSSMLGYFASVEFRNNSKTEGELFSVGCEIFESSK